MRANMLDELQQALRDDGARQGAVAVTLLMKYPRALGTRTRSSRPSPGCCPTLSRAPSSSPSCSSLPTAGPLLLQSLMSQDMYLAGAFVLLICALTLVGSLVSDILLALVDPRIRLE